MLCCQLATLIKAYCILFAFCYSGTLDLSVKQDILLNRSIKDAIVAEEKFFRSRPV